MTDVPQAWRYRVTLYTSGEEYDTGTRQWVNKVSSEREQEFTDREHFDRFAVVMRRTGHVVHVVKVERQPVSHEWETVTWT